MVGAGVQSLPAGRLIALHAAPGRIPVPVILAISAEADIFSEAIQRARAGAMWLVIGDGIGDLSQGVESLWSLRHKLLDATPTFGFDAWRHVHQHQRRCSHVGFANGDEADTAPH